ncbi:glutamine synthetase III [Thermoanaerobacterium thermosaccharolyticum]|jgi:glutamine synthetase|uniref:Glutamine synthetase catalytic region n=1 Tax=Thermoanaerobacterium thermosaccharolyticum (strain ATCC 7956 / DSM 571 / NCIMB 9385 / NCA 3814 / NCTC 13789 / WDCM 00135 / 2032) TaxID=580327 RepID=D9TPP8_THETC|nr:glutamine synthetase III [Thermoanaerobacterium thermosaccharolyticum]TCW42045.1 L-glutamine synthetase [Thermohydrogenium kirishiense]ADL68730.1 glutamine synthetase catalytic region [Thermoanaerobacterium thermosaccharolyticum DSM 571]MBE0069507.1 glutamine synthetase type III [Thermoanaerobacterium thermosaccharolyticum]MBE0229188.1 glutamine synthetase type III [Thermoanaerobacterium thermosaccharolyticum]MCP2241265.1 glutamine synthetase [Thermoanaerobacterium thermosaccharolyticum]
MQEKTLKNIFRENVFNDAVMRERLPKQTYNALRKTIDEGLPLDPKVADVVANAMKDWAIEKGATHFTHWFQPLTGITAEKHESFISPTPDGKVITEFSGKELIKGEPDASSFPSGGLRATFEARGYTAWDCTSPAFVRDNVLYIPTAFCSYTGEALDLKTPLLRSMEALSKEALRVLRLFGNTTSKRVITTVGPEQEYFLIDKKLYEKRKDLILTGRTLFGAKPPKGQEMEDHYFGTIRERVSTFMKELDEELWKLGISAKTEHNEVAPAQHELAPIFNTTNIATDHNQLTMDIMKKVALRNDLVCLLHEKPFAGVNGSGKHNNWSMSTDDGINLLDPGKTPHENAQFLVFLCSVIKAIDEYADLLRVSCATPGNDHRLGANEAPPAIISIFLGDQLTDILEQIGENGGATNSKQGGELKIGVTTLPTLHKDSTDRNRTSPFAFTGNKFEFRMVGSSSSIATANYILNTIVAEVLSEVADRLENATNFDEEVQKILKEIVTNHKRVIFNGNGYSEEWVKEAEKRGLPNISSTVDAIPALLKDKNVKVMEKHGVLSKVELESRYEIMLENYTKTINIEALTMLDIAKRQLLPSVIKFIKEVADSINAAKGTGLDVTVDAQSDLLNEVSSLAAEFKKRIDILENAVNNASNIEGDSFAIAKYYRDEVFVKMSELREIGDKLETLVDADIWPLPTYADMLFYV